MGNYPLSLIHKSRKFKVILYFPKDKQGYIINTKTEKTIIAKQPIDAIKEFMKLLFPEDTFTIPLRLEQPSNESLNVWSTATTASGQRIWVYEI